MIDTIERPPDKAEDSATVANNDDVTLYAFTMKAPRGLVSFKPAGVISILAIAFHDGQMHLLGAATAEDIEKLTRCPALDIAKQDELSTYTDDEIRLWALFVVAGMMDFVDAVINPSDCADNSTSDD